MEADALKHQALAWVTPVSVIGKTKHQFTRVELGNERFGIAVTWLSYCIKEIVLSQNLSRASVQSLSFCSAWGVSAWDSLNTLPHQSAAALRELLSGFDQSECYATFPKAL